LRLPDCSRLHAERWWLRFALGLADAQRNARALVIDATAVFWVNAGTDQFDGAVMKIAKPR
jgi:hypothetical protein